VGNENFKTKLFSIVSFFKDKAG